MISIISLFLLLVSSTAQAHIFVGNGGEGMRVGGKLHVRDLYDYNLHIRPFFGSTTDLIFNFEAEPDGLAELGYPRALLLRKLTDINIIEPDLGTALLVAMRHYTWLAVDEPLGLLPDDGPMFVQPGTRVQIANRDLTTIRVDRKLWRELSPENQVALLIHEAVYSLVRPVCQQGSPNCAKKTQSARWAREITSHFFRLDQKPLPIGFRTTLNIPQNTYNCSYIAPGMWLKIIETNADNIKQKYNWTVPQPLSRASRESSAYEFCLQAELTGKGVGAKRIAVRFTRPWFSLIPLTYATDYGTQLALQMAPRNTEWEPSVSIYPGDSCVNKIERLARDWFENSASQDGTGSCALIEIPI